MLPLRKGQAEHGIHSGFLTCKKIANLEEGNVSIEKWLRFHSLRGSIRSMVERVEIGVGKTQSNETLQIVENQKTYRQES